MEEISSVCLWPPTHMYTYTHMLREREKEEWGGREKYSSQISPYCPQKVGDVSFPLGKMAALQQVPVIGPIMWVHLRPE